MNYYLTVSGHSSIIRDIERDILTELCTYNLKVSPVLPNTDTAQKYRSQMAHMIFLLPCQIKNGAKQTNKQKNKPTVRPSKVKHV